MSRIFIGLAIIPLPIILFFGALALPLRKDQPMEVYLAALLSFYLKPRKRVWVPDGVESLVEITAPQVVEVHRTKDLDQTEAERRLSYLADIADSQGWAIRHSVVPGSASSMVADVYNEANQTEDLLDTNSSLAQSFGTMIDQTDARHREEIINAVHAQASAQTHTQTPPPLSDPYASLAPPSHAATPTDDTTQPDINYNPYPDNIHQRVIHTVSEQQDYNATQTAPKPDNTTSNQTISPDIMNLANRSSLSVETIANEAHRLQEKENGNNEVVVSWR